MTQDRGVGLSIIIVNWNTRDLLAQCLESLYAHQPDCGCEVFVVDNASGDGSAQMVRERFPQVRLIVNEENLGFARANNQAIGSSVGRYALLLNSDTSVQGDELTAFINFLDVHPHVGIVGPTLRNLDGSFQASYGDFPTFTSELISTAGLQLRIYGRYYPSHPPERSREPQFVDWVGGACLAARRDAIEQVGLLDESYFMYSEEMDWCYRFRHAGWEVCYLPDVAVIHFGGQSTQLVGEKRLLWLTQSKMRFLRKYCSGPQVLVLLVCLRVVAVAKAAYWFFRAIVCPHLREPARSKARVNWLIANGRYS